MIRGLDVGIKRQVVAKLRERGLAEDNASQLADSQLEEAKKFFGGRLATHQLTGKSAEMSLDDSFEDLAKWAAQLPTAS